jgi:hypothetical protein
LCLCGDIIAANPTLTTILPRGGQRGTAVAVTFTGVNLADAQEVFCYSPGLKVADFKVVNNNQAQAKLTIPADCPLGEHAFRVRTATGISELRTFWVGALPVVDEKEPNSEFTQAQKIPLNVTVHGVITNEDVDYFAVEAKKGQRLSVEIEGLRVAAEFFDPAITIFDSRRFEVATSDDCPLLGQDGCISVVIPADGTYVIQVRESAYRGGPNGFYRLHVGTFPRPLAVLPAGGRPGEEVEVRFLGDPTGEVRRKVKLPAEPRDKYGLYLDDAGSVSPSPVPFRVNDLRNVLEAEPNDSPTQATPAGEAPCALNGIIERPGDMDYYRVTLKKGVAYDFHCYARRLGSPLDSVMILMQPTGQQVIADDDAVRPDSYFRFTAPEDKEYVLAVHDHLRKGGPTYTYRVEITPVAQSLTVALPQFAQFTQDRQWIAVPRGNRYATLLSATRANFGGDLTFEGVGLPAKLSMSTDTMPAGMTVVPVVLEAAPDAPVGGALAEFHGRPVDPKVQVPERFNLKSELVYGNPNNALFWSYNAPKVAVAVTEEAPFKVTVVAPKVPLVRNGVMGLKVVAERKPGFNAPINIYPLYNPPGVGSAGAVTIPQGQTEAVFPLNANLNAALRKWPYVVWGMAGVGNGPVWVSSPLTPLEVASSYVSVTLDRAACEQGQQTKFTGKVQVATPWEGPAKLKLLGLPPGVEAPEVTLTKDSTEFQIPLTVAKTCPAGQHRNIICQVTVPQDGEAVTHNLGGGQLRIDVPLKK